MNDKKAVQTPNQIYISYLQITYNCIQMVQMLIYIFTAKNIDSVIDVCVYR